MWANHKLSMGVLACAGLACLVGLAIADNGATNGTTVPTINGRPLVNNNDGSSYQTVDGRPLRQPVSGTQQPQPSLLDKMGTGTKNFFSRIGNWFSPNDSSNNAAGNSGIKRPSTAASNKAIESADRININGSQVPVGYNPDGSKR